MTNNIGFIEKDENNKYFVDIQLPRDCDISTGFSISPYYSSKNSSTDVKMSLKINSKFLSINRSTKIVNACAMYTDIKIRVTFENEPFPVILKYLCYLLQPDLRFDLIKKTFNCDGMIYSQGVLLI